MPDLEARPPDRPTEDEEATGPSPSHPSGGEWLASSRAQALANVLTILVALAAIGLSVWEGLENRRHNRLSVLPYLEPYEVTSNVPIEDDRFLLPTGFDSIFTVSYGVRNTGLGPAVVQNVLVYQDGEAVFDAAASEQGTYYPGQLRANLRALPFPVGTLQQAYSVDQMMKASEAHVLLTAYAPFAGIDRDSLAQTDTDPIGVMREAALPQRSVVICYCSVYGEDCDATHLGAEPPADAACGF